MCPLPRNYAHDENQCKKKYLLGLQDQGTKRIAGAGYYLYSISRLSYNYNTIQYRQELHKLCRHRSVQFALFTYPHGYPNPHADGTCYPNPYPHGYEDVKFADLDMYMDILRILSQSRYQSYIKQQSSRHQFPIRHG